MVKVRKDLTGKRFGKLIVLEQAEDYINLTTGKHRSQWLCQCDCGNKAIVTGYCLNSEHTKSCGCLQSETTIMKNKSRKKQNKYDLSGDYGIGYTYDDKPFYFDKKDFDIIKNYCWHDSNGYLIAHVYRNNKRTTQRMHRLILGLESNKNKDVLVDHINHNTFDNRRSNLRFVDNSRNQMNKDKSIKNTSGIVGVKYHKLTSKWEVDITKNGNRIYLGLYDNFSDAVKVRKDAEEKYFGEYSYDNSMILSNLIEQEMYYG